MSNFKERYDMWREHNTDKYWRPWVRWIFLGLSFGLGFTVFMLDGHAFMPAYFAGLATINLHLLVFDWRMIMAKNKAHKPSRKQITVGIITAVIAYLAICVVASLKDPKPAFVPVKGGFELDNGGALLIALPLLPLTMGPFIAVGIILQKQFIDKRRIKGVPKKKLFS